MKNRIQASVGLLILLFCCSCSSWYGYAGKRYDTKEEALQAQRNNISNILSKIEQRPECKFKNALLVLPSREAIKERGLSGNVDTSSDVIEYLVSTVEANSNCMAEVLKKSNLFESVDVQYDLYPGVVAYEKRKSYEAIIYLKLPGNGDCRVMLVTPKSNKENLVFLENKTPHELSGFQFWLKNIEKTVQEDRVNTESISVAMKDQMTNERIMTKHQDNAEQEISSPGRHDQPISQNQQSHTYFVSFNPFSYPNLHSTDLGKGETVAILNLPDRRQDAKVNDTHIGTIYGMVYHNPLYEIHSANGVSQNAIDAMATLFMANGFEVKKYPDSNSAPPQCEARFIVTGQVNKLWTKCFHSAEAEVDFDIKIYDTNLKKEIWSGKIENYELEDPKMIMGLTGFLNKVLGDAINKAWNDKLMRASFDSLAKEAIAKETVEDLEKAASNSPMNAKDLLRLGSGYFDMKRYADSIDALKKAIDIT